MAVRHHLDEHALGDRLVCYAGRSDHPTGIPPVGPEGDAVTLHAEVVVRPADGERGPLEVQNVVHVEAINDNAGKRFGANCRMALPGEGPVAPDDAVSDADVDSTEVRRFAGPRCGPEGAPFC